jgi:hypothetical protein
LDDNGDADQSTLTSRLSELERIVNPLLQRMGGSTSSSEHSHGHGHGHGAPSSSTTSTSAPSSTSSAGAPSSSTGTTGYAGKVEELD